MEPPPDEQQPTYLRHPAHPFPLEELTPLLEQIWANKILTNGGPMHQRLEAALCDYLGVPHISLFNNATVALVAAVQALGVTGDVITTPYSFVATAHSLMWSAVTPIFVDVDPHTLNLDPAKIEAAITPQTTAIMPVHCYGHPCDVEAIEAIARAHKLKVIYDAAHAFGVRCYDKSVLRYGDLSILSFHATKVFNTFEGGAIISHSAEMKQRVDQIKNFGLTDEITVSFLGMNGKMSEFNAALGLLQLRYVDQAIAQRQAADLRYRRLLEGCRGVRCMQAPALEDRSNFSYFPILIDEDYPISRDALYSALKAENIHARRYFYPLISDFAPYRGLATAHPENLPVATRAAQQVLCLPLFPALGDEDAQRIVGIIRAER